MARRGKYQISDFLRAISGSGGNKTTIAETLNCSPATVTRYINKYPELKEAFEREESDNMAGVPQYTVEQFVKAIDGSRGIIGTIAKRVGCSRATAKRYIFEYYPDDLRELYEDERQMILDEAESQLVSDMRRPPDDEPNVRQRAYMFVLERLGKEDYSQRTEHTGADGVPLFSPELLQKMQALGIDEREAVQQFEMLINSLHEANHGTD